MVYDGCIIYQKGEDMKDSEFEKLISSGTSQKAKISDKKRYGDITNIYHVFSQEKTKSKAYIQVAHELVERLKKRGVEDFSKLSVTDLTDLEIKALAMIRNDSALDTQILKGDNVISTFLVLEKIVNQRLAAELKPKRMQLSDTQIQKIFELKSQGFSLRKISEKMNLSRITVTRVIKKDYISPDDVKRIESVIQNLR